jgi:hypothetical protein
MEHGVLGGVLGELFLGDIGASPEEKPSSRIFTDWTANDVFAKYLLVHDTHSGASLRALPRGRPSGGGKHPDINRANSNAPSLTRRDTRNKA